MHRLPAALLAALLGAAAPAGAAAQQAEPSPAAMAFAAEFGGDHLSGMLSRIGAQTEALRVLGQLDPQTVAIAFDAQIDAAVRRHGDEWARNLALAWSPLLSDAEMASLVELGAASPHAEKYLAGREAAARRMAELSRELFSRILHEVVTATVATLDPDTPAE